MPAKLLAICYIHSCTERIAREYILKEVTGIVRLQDDDSTKVIYLNVKAFLTVNEPTNDLIELFETGDVVYLKGKFIGNNNYYLVSAISIKMLNFDFNTMPALGINLVIVGVTTQTVKEIEGNLILEFHVEERIGDKEASNFTVEAKHNSNNKFLSNKTTSINQNARLMTVVLVGTIYYKFDNDMTSGKHIIMLEDLSIITSNREFLNMQTLTIPWLSQMTIPRYSQRTNRQPRGATPRPSKNKNASLSNMNATSVQQILLAALGKNPIPNMTNEQPA
ncbi:hypothetical protein F8M41_024792 [Gigaspora margarita]|uniref:Uncharacterized protein n=1 Tax=Gigaspora margarita TaxID=4874 RepID=A0A8H3XK75_GIGMA|nr:hypothetical protein F8M41_024792 [Gigaspora margarita]